MVQFVRVIDLLYQMTKYFVIGACYLTEMFNYLWLAMADRSMSTRGSDSASVRDGSVVVGAESPAVSELTTPSATSARSNLRNQQIQRLMEDASDRVEDVMLSDLPDDPTSPVRRLDMSPEEEERWYESQIRLDNPGADDSDEEDEEDLALASNEAKIERQLHDDDILRAVELDCAAWADYVASYHGEMDLERATHAAAQLIPSTAIFVHGSPPGWVPPSAPNDWVRPPPKTTKKEPNVPFEEIDNPGNWSEYCFRPKFGGKAGTGDYVGHQLPTGVSPVPLTNGKRSAGGFDFFYTGWQKEIPDIRSGATRDNMWPDSHKGSLDKNVLMHLGLTPDKMEEADRQPDALFFYQLILPIHNVDNRKTLTVPNDPRKPFYANVSRWTNSYACEELGILGGGCGHDFKAMSPTECLQWDGAIVMDGVLGGSKGAFLRRFDTRKGNQMYSKEIAGCFTKSHWLELKRCYKLCNNLTAKKKGTPEHEPAYKHDYIWDVICHNTNAITLFAELDLCLDETSFAFNGWGEAGTGLFGLVMGKPNITRGGQSCLLSDAHRIRPRAYLHRHKLHHKHYNCAGPNEVRLLWEWLHPLFQQSTYRTRGIFRQKPHITCDNFFSRDDIVNYACEQGFGLTMTCRRDRLPRGAPSKHLCKLKTPVNKRTRASCWMHPIFCLKRHHTGALIQLTTFQSTSSCNLIHVNGVNSNSMCGSAKERGKGLNKRQWAIEMNESRRLYLDSYGRIDSIDHLVKNCNMCYR